MAAFLEFTDKPLVLLFEMDYVAIYLRVQYCKLFKIVG